MVDKNTTDKHLERIETKIDRIDNKLDNISARTSITETDIIWVKGGLALSLAIILSVVGYLATILAGLLNK
jgi:hypothetical protein